MTNRDVTIRKAVPSLIRFLKGFSDTLFMLFKFAAKIGFFLEIHRIIVKFVEIDHL